MTRWVSKEQSDGNQNKQMAAPCSLETFPSNSPCSEYDRKPGKKQKKRLEREDSHQESQRPTTPATSSPSSPSTSTLSVSRLLEAPRLESETWLYRKAHQQQWGAAASGKGGWRNATQESRVESEAQQVRAGVWGSESVCGGHGHEETEQAGHSQSVPSLYLRGRETEHSRRFPRPPLSGHQVANLWFYATGPQQPGTASAWPQQSVPEPPQDPLP